MNTSYETLRSSCQATLDQLMHAANVGMHAPTVLSLIEKAEGWRRSAPETWPALVDDVLSKHPLAALASECPMTDRARRKPRGYAGDAVMLDYIYDRSKVADEQLGGSQRDVFRVVAESPTCASVDYRRHMIAQRIDALASQRSADGLAKLTLLSLACGHARELDLVRSMGEGKILRAVMCDQDSASLTELRARYSAELIDPRALAVRQFLAHAAEVEGLGQFDLVYSAGLYDYLEQRTATRLTACLFERLAPGGQLLLANFHPANLGTGYMEAFMDWWLIYRSEDQMRELAQEIDPTQIASAQIETDPFGNVVYLTITRRSRDGDATVMRR